MSYAGHDVAIEAVVVPPLGGHIMLCIKMCKECHTLRYVTV